MFMTTLRALIIAHGFLAMFLFAMFGAQQGMRLGVSAYCAYGVWVGVGDPPACDH